jgi:hypothetical protein
MLTGALALLVGVFSAGSLKAQEVPANPKVVTAYVKPAKAELIPIHDRLKDRQVLERMASFLYPVKLPETFKISAAECGGIFKPFNRRDGVVLCYELVALIRKSAKKAYPDNAAMYQMAVVGALTQTMLYRTALGLLDVLDIPVWGRYADAADKLAAYVMLRFGGEATAAITMEGATQFFLGSDKTWTGSDFAETRSPTGQRFYNYACMAFGSNPERFQHFKSDIGFLLRAGFVAHNGSLNEGVTDANNFCTYEFAEAKLDFWAALVPHIEANRLGRLKGFQIFSADDFQ